MTYKTILVHVDDTRHVAARVEIAANLAIAQDAHLIGAALSGVSRFIEQAVAVNPDDPAIRPYLDTLRRRANAALDRFHEQAGRLGLLSVERRLVDDETTDGIALQARYCDLVVVGQTDPDEPVLTVRPDFPEYIATSSGAPVLIVPYARSFPRVGSRILVAWNASHEAKRAVQDALPLMKGAEQVDVAVFNPAEHPERYGAYPGADIKQYLARHGIPAALRMEHGPHGEIGDALLAIAAEATSNLLVMGCYGHSRFREMLLGGVTRSILTAMTLPVLMSH
ncbi:MAG: universal stress protein [Herminiimonas sp.]|nr:universal stress protein [Herminiimonas sp.]